MTKKYDILQYNKTNISAAYKRETNIKERGGPRLPHPQSAGQPTFAWPPECNGPLPATSRTDQFGFEGVME